MNAPLLTANGTPVLIGGQPVFAGTPSAFNAVSTTTTGGFSDAMSSVFHNNFPTYAVGLNLTLPIRNRAAQADSARALLLERSAQASYLQLQNTVAVNVRNAQIALVQDRAQVDAAIKAGELAKQTLEAEQKKYQLGASTSYNVILRSRDLTTAQGNELRARINLVEAFINYDQSLGRTLTYESDYRGGCAAREYFPYAEYSWGVCECAAVCAWELHVQGELIRFALDAGWSQARDGRKMLA